MKLKRIIKQPKIDVFSDEEFSRLATTCPVCGLKIEESIKNAEKRWDGQSLSDWVFKCNQKNKKVLFKCSGCGCQWIVKKFRGKIL